LKNIFFIIIITLISTVFFTACKKDSFITGTNAQLRLSADTIKYDTVFTTTGSITKTFKIINTNDKKLLLSKVKLMGGAASAYKMNVNGIATSERNDIEIAANDSIYVFVTVTINPTAVNLPFIVRDSIQINYNSLTKYVQLQAYGQNAIFINNGLVISNVNFTAALPYVILGSLQVATGATLTLNAGTKLYSHADAPIIIDGTLIANGTKTQPVVFAGDRLDDPYVNFPAAWPGIFFRTTSKDNVLKFVQVKNAYQAIVVLQPSVNANPKLVLKQSILDNALDAGLLCTNTNVTVDNTLVSNCGRGLSVSHGGTYNFTHCTFASFSNNYVQHKNPSVYISDANELNQTNALSAVLRNTIIYGDAGLVQNEIQTNKVGTVFNVNLDYCLYRNTTDPTNCTINQSIKNVNPSFDSVNNVTRFYDFRITKNSTAAGINKGTATSFLKDLDDNNRAVGLPDIGAYEKQ
jgi:hypothetical protein